METLLSHITEEKNLKEPLDSSGKFLTSSLLPPLD